MKASVLKRWRMVPVRSRSARQAWHAMAARVDQSGHGDSAAAQVDAQIAHVEGDNAERPA